jgi:hypothetical protein
MRAKQGRMSGQAIVREGGCGCGKVRFRTDAREPIFVNNCYCALCQLQTGSTSSAYAFYEAEAVEILSGELVRFAQQTGTDRKQQVMQCADCGVGLFFQPWPTGRHGISVRLGAFDDPWDIVPDAAVYVTQRMPWVTLPDGVPAFEAYYKPDELLPPDRHARLKRLVDKHKADQHLSEDI